MEAREGAGHGYVYPSSSNTSAHSPFLLGTQLELSLHLDKVRIPHLFWTETGLPVQCSQGTLFPSILGPGSPQSSQSRVWLEGTAWGQWDVGAIWVSWGISGKLVQLCFPQMDNRDGNPNLGCCQGWEYKTERQKGPTQCQAFNSK